MFTPDPWGKWSKLTSISFSWGWFNHTNKKDVPGRIQKSNQSLRPLCLPGTISWKMLPQPTNRKGPIFFCFRPGKMGRIWRSFCWKRATVFMASFDDPLVSIPHVSIISSTRREWWGMVGDVRSGQCGWCDWDVIEMSLMWLMWHVTEDHIIFEVVCDVDVGNVLWADHQTHPIPNAFV